MRIDDNVVLIFDCRDHHGCGIPDHEFRQVKEYKSFNITDNDVCITIRWDENEKTHKVFIRKGRVAMPVFIFDKACELAGKTFTEKAIEFYKRTHADTI
jgi:hypothetical protein